MSNRIETGNNPSPTTDYGDKSTTSASESAGVESTEQTGQTARSGEAADSIEEDVWEESNPSNYDEVVSRGGQENYASPAEVEDAIAVWEIMGADGTSDSAESTEEDFELGDNLTAQHMVALFDELEGERASPAEIRRELNYRVFDNTSQSSQIELAAHRDELREVLIQQFDDPSLVDGFIDELESKVVSLAGERITARARPALEEGMENLEQLNASSDSRRAFLATVATGVDSQEEIADALHEFGLSSSTAQDMAEVLDEVRTDPDVRQAFIDGDEGANESLLQRTGDFDKIDREFESELDDAHQGLESLWTQTGTNEIRHDKFLTDPTTEPIRDEVLADMGANMEPGDTNELGELFLEATEKSEFSQFLEGVGIAGVSVAASIGVTVLTAGLGTGAAVAAGMATTAAQEVPGIAGAELDADIARGAAQAGFVDPALIDKADGDKNVAYAMAAANIAVAGATGYVGGDTAAAAGEVVNAGKETADLAGDR